MTVNRVVAIVSAVVVIVAALAGLYLSGSPSEQRLLRLDERRVRDLNQLANAIQIYWQEQDQLPATLRDVVDGRRLDRLPADPDDRRDYEYSPGEKTFRLCAEFDRSSPESDVVEFWNHPAGRHCFEFDTTVNIPLGRMPAIRAMPLGP